MGLPLTPVLWLLTQQILSSVIPLNRKKKIKIILPLEIIESKNHLRWKTHSRSPSPTTNMTYWAPSKPYLSLSATSAPFVLHHTQPPSLSCPGAGSSWWRWRNTARCSWATLSDYCYQMWQRALSGKPGRWKGQKKLDEREVGETLVSSLLPAGGGSVRMLWGLRPGLTTSPLQSQVPFLLLVKPQSLAPSLLPESICCLHLAPIPAVTALKAVSTASQTYTGMDRRPLAVPSLPMLALLKHLQAKEAQNIAWHHTMTAQRQGLAVTVFAATPCRALWQQFTFM